MICIWWYICDIYFDVSHACGMLDVFDDIYYILNDMPDDIWWYLNKADIFDDIFDTWLTIFDFSQNYSTHNFGARPCPLRGNGLYNVGFNKSFSF